MPVVTLTTIGGTATFANLQGETATGWQIATGLVVVLAAVLAALQTFLDYSARAEKHRAAASAFTARKRELDIMVVQIKSNLDSPEIFLQKYSNIVAAINSLEADSVDVEDRYYDRGRREQEADTEGV